MLILKIISVEISEIIKLNNTLFDKASFKKYI
jgi:hypothetical protein